METLDIFILVGTVVFILVLWLIVGFRHLKHLKAKIHRQWDVLDEGLRKRHNLMPNLIETFRKFITDQGLLINKLIKEKNSAAKEYYPGGNKVVVEHELTSTINELMLQAKNNNDLKKDTNFLEIKKEINDLEVRTLGKSKKYNKKVRAYNMHRKFIVLKPISWMFGFKVENIFEMEV